MILVASKKKSIASYKYLTWVLTKKLRFRLSCSFSFISLYSLQGRPNEHVFMYLKRILFDNII